MWQFGEENASIKLGIGGLVLGLFLILTGVWERSDAGGVEKEPQKLSYEELLFEGVGENRHVTLTDFVPCESGYVVTVEGVNERVTEAFVPVCSPDSEGDPNGEGLRVVVRMRGFTSEDAMWVDLDNGQLTGVVYDGTRKIDSETRNLLAQAYPGIDTSKCTVLDVGGRLPNTSYGVWMIGAGVIAMLVGGVALAVNFLPNASGGDAAAELTDDYAARAWPDATC